MTRLSDSVPAIPEIERLKQAGDIPALIRHLSHPDLSVQWHAAEALGTCGEAAVLPLIASLNSRSVPVRLGAIEALGMIRDSRAVVPLSAIPFQDKSPEVRWAAILALGEVGSVEAVPFLVPILRNPDRYQRYGAAIALGRLGWQPENETDTAYLLIARQDWEAVRSLGPAALPPLWDLLRDNNPDSRAMIVTIIGQTGDPVAREACQKALKDRDPRVRWKAVLASMDCGLASHNLPLMVAGRERTGPDPAAAALLNFLFLGIGYNYIGKWWGFPVFMTYMSVLVLAQLALGPFLPYVIAYPITTILGIHTYYLAERMPDL
jgi:HEAT repeat protein